MAFQEVITSNGHILYSLPEEKYQLNSEKIFYFPCKGK